MSFPCRIGISFHPFVKDSICRRLADILQSVLDADVSFPTPEARAKVSSAVRHIRDLTLIIEGITADDGGPDWTEAAYAPYVGKGIAEVDWFFLENYAYRFLLHHTGYFRTKIDPFSAHKQQAIDKALPLVSARLEVGNKEEVSLEARFRAQLILTLVGNRADLSLSAGKIVEATSEAAEGLLLVDDIAKVFGIVREARKVVMVLDNCGAELMEDLLMVQLLLTRFDQLSIALHCKSHPVFVSDAIEADVWQHMKLIRDVNEDYDLQRLVDAGRIEVSSHPFYTTPFSFFDMPEDLAQELFAADLVVTKGDANYRRLLGDGAWPYNTAFADVMSYWRSPIVAVRTCKSPVIVGVSSETLQRAKAEDKDWLLNGRYGVVQLKP